LLLTKVLIKDVLQLDKMHNFCHKYLVNKVIVIIWRARSSLRTLVTWYGPLGSLRVSSDALRCLNVPSVDFLRSVKVI
jgi:hypothetical protein